MLSGKNEQLMLSQSATKSPQRQQAGLQNSNELSTLATPLAPLALHGDAVTMGGWMGRAGGRGDITVMPPVREDEITLID